MCARMGMVWSQARAQGCCTGVRARADENRGIAVPHACTQALLLDGEDKAAALLHELMGGQKKMRARRRAQERRGASTSFLYHEVAAQEVPPLDVLGGATFCLCLWTFIRELLGDQKKPTLLACVDKHGPSRREDVWVSVRWTPRSAWRHFEAAPQHANAERSWREVHTATAVAGGSAHVPCAPLHLVGAILHRFWAVAVASAAKQAGGGYHGGGGGAVGVGGGGSCGKWLSLILELDKEKGLGLSMSSTFVSDVSAALVAGRNLDRCVCARAREAPSLEFFCSSNMLIKPPKVPAGIADAHCAVRRGAK